MFVWKVLRLTSEKVSDNDILTLFKLIDTNMNGSITVAELASFLRC